MTFLKNTLDIRNINVNYNFGKNQVGAIFLMVGEEDCVKFLWPSQNK